jgi:hypothetical protein
MSAVYRNLEQQAKDTLKNIVFRCPSQRGKKNTLDYSYRTFPGAVNLREIAVDNLLIPAVRLRTGENKKAYHRFDKIRWYEISNTHSAALISPQAGEMLLHAPHETLGQLAPPKTPTPAPAIASSSRKRASSASSVELIPLATTLRKSGSEVLARLTGSSPPANVNWIANMLSQDPLKLSQKVAANRSSMVKEISDLPITQNQPLEQRVDFAQSTLVIPLPSPSVSYKSRSPTNSVSSPEEEGRPSRGSPRPTSFPQPLIGIARPEKDALGHLVEALVEEKLADLNWISLIQPTDPPVEHLFDPHLIQIGKTMADMHNVRAAKIRHVNELADGRPPINPLPKAFQCPLMSRLASTGLVETLNILLLECGVAMSRELIKAEEKLEEELRRELITYQGDVLPTNAESHVIRIISEARERNQQVYRPRTDPLIYYDITGTGNLARITPHESSMKANTSKNKIPGKQGANAPKVDNKGSQPKTPAKATNKSKGKSLAPSNKQGKGPGPGKAHPIPRGDKNFIDVEPAVPGPPSTSLLPVPTDPAPAPKKTQQKESTSQVGSAKPAGKQAKKGGKAPPKGDKNPPKNQQRSKKAGAGRSNWNQRPAPYHPPPLMDQRPFSGPPTWMPPPMQGYDRYRTEYAPRQSPYYDERDGYSQHGRERRDYYRT